MRLDRSPDEVTGVTPADAAALELLAVEVQLAGAISIAQPSEPGASVSTGETFTRAANRTNVRDLR